MKDEPQPIFSASAVRRDDGGFWFECAMVSSCRPVFDACSDNHEVEDVLRNAKVLLPSNKTDTECCALVVLFNSNREGQRFLRRLNAYLKLKWPDAPPGRQ